MSHNTCDDCVNCFVCYSYAEGQPADRCIHFVSDEDLKKDYKNNNSQPYNLVSNKDDRSKRTLCKVL